MSGEWEYGGVVEGGGAGGVRMEGLLLRKRSPDLDYVHYDQFLCLVFERWRWLEGQIATMYAGQRQI